MYTTCSSFGDLPPTQKKNPRGKDWMTYCKSQMYMWSTWRSGQAHCMSCILPWISISLCLSSWSCFSSCCCCLSFSSYNFSLKNKHFTSCFTQVTLKKLTCCSMFSSDTKWTENTSIYPGTQTLTSSYQRGWYLSGFWELLLGCYWVFASNLHLH